MSHLRYVPGLLVAILVVGACGASHSMASDVDNPARANEQDVDYDSAASWSLDPSFPSPKEGQSQIRVLVNGLACSGGQERTLGSPRVESDEEAVTVTFTVEPLPAGHYTCPGRPGQPYAVDLGEELGARRLVDGFCLGSGPLVETVYCENDRGIRWKP